MSDRDQRALGRVPQRLDEMQKVARDVRAEYSIVNTVQGRPAWGVEQYMAGFVGDVGDLSKLVTASQGYRDRGDIQIGIEHELSDCLWSLLVLADEFDIDLPTAFDRTMSGLLDHLARNRSSK